MQESSQFFWGVGVDVIEAAGIFEEIQNRIEGCPCRGFPLEKIDSGEDDRARRAGDQVTFEHKRHMRKFNGVLWAYFGLTLKKCEWRFDSSTPSS